MNFNSLNLLVLHASLMKREDKGFHSYTDLPMDIIAHVRRRKSRNCKIAAFLHQVADHHYSQHILWKVKQILSVVYKRFSKRYRSYIELVKNKQLMRYAEINLTWKFFEGHFLKKKAVKI